MKKYFVCTAIAIAVAGVPYCSFAQTRPKVQKSFSIKSAGRWDYIFVDPNSEKLYVSHGTQVNVLNKESGDSIGVVAPLRGVHGIALAPEQNLGFITNGASDTLTVFDPSTLAIKSGIATGKGPDAVFYDDYSKKIVVCNGHGNSLSIIDPQTLAVTSTVALTGKPETAVSDGKGKIFVNIEDKNGVAAVDMKTNKVIAFWPLAPGEGPSGLSIDRKTKRLFAGCDKKLVVMDATNGKVVAHVPIGDGCDGTAFDPGTKTVYASCGDGTLAAIKEVSKDKYTLLQNIVTQKSARTVCLDEGTHTLYLPAAEFEKAKPGERWPAMVPGSFKILVVR